jgi:hypothetical protein
MDAIATMQTCKSLDPKEEFISDLDAEIHEIVLTLGNLIEIKNNLTQIPNFILDNFCSSLFEVTIEPTFPFPNFIHWVEKNYVKSNSQILTSNGSRIVCTINYESVISSLGLPSIAAEQNIVQFSELTSLEAIKTLNPEELTSFMSKTLKPGVIETQDMIPYDLSSFLDPIQAIFSLLSQILGSESDQLVKKVMVRTLYLVSQSQEPRIFRYEEFLVNRITSQLENFNNSGKIFRYQTLLILIVINNNLQTLKQMHPTYFAKDVNLSERNCTMSYINFIDKVMSSLHKLIFGISLLRMTKEMKVYMQNSNEPVGDWFLYQEFTVLRVSGFEDKPYRLQVFLTKRIFVLEFLR